MKKPDHWFGPCCKMSAYNDAGCRCWTEGWTELRTCTTAYRLNYVFWNIYMYIYININLFQRSDSTYIGSYFHRGGKDNCTWVRGQPKQVVRTRCFKYIDFSGVNVPLQTTLSVRPSVCMSLVRPSDIIVSSLSSCCHSSEPLIFFFVSDKFLWNVNLLLRL